jgi:hypothetical protein
VHELEAHATPAALTTLVLQFLVQLPHCATLFDVFVSQPVFCPVEQWLKPWLQLHLHEPLWQEELDAFVVLQLVPH